jgi:tRNA-(ms[2]io[6]A)-hydroxylase
LLKKNIEEILVDHAWCEQKSRQHRHQHDYPPENLAWLTNSPTWWPRSGFTSKEFLDCVRFSPMAPQDEYVVQAKLCDRAADGARERQLMDQLLVSALIEALRSCERFKLLWQHIASELSKFYYELMVSQPRILWLTWIWQRNMTPNW